VRSFRGGAQFTGNRIVQLERAVAPIRFSPAPARHGSRIALVPLKHAYEEERAARIDMLLEALRLNTEDR
jgi:hypothetical protein